MSTHNNGKLVQGPLEVCMALGLRTLSFNLFFSHNFCEFRITTTKLLFFFLT